MIRLLPPRYWRLAFWRWGVGFGFWVSDYGQGRCRYWRAIRLSSKEAVR